MFTLFAKKLTAASNHYVDWSRAGEFVRSGNHRYTPEELRARAGIIVFTALSGFLGAYLNDKEKTQCPSITIGVASALVGFIVSHGVTMAPLIMKRHAISLECTQLRADILSELNDLSGEEEKVAFVNATVQSIMQLSITDKNERASQIWNRRKFLLTRVLDELATDHAVQKEFWQGDVASVMEKLAAVPTHELNKSPAISMSR